MKNAGSLWSQRLQAARPAGTALLITILLATVPAAAKSAWREAEPGYHYQFPRDHFEHPDFLTEWWYYTGNVIGPAGERFGFELVFFRQGEHRLKQNKSEWAVRDLYLAHTALTDAAGKRFRYQERLNRAGPGVAGASFETRRIWNANWSAQWNIEDQSAGNQRLDVQANDFSFHLELEPQKPYVIHGENGISQKADGPGRASHYVSFPLLQVSGTIAVEGISRQVTGRAWMDHEWFTEQLAGNQVGWDWFSVQLDDGTELMLFELRRKDGSIDPHSSGTFIGRSGETRHLRRSEFSLEPLSRRWGKYPIEWRLRVPAMNINLTCHAVLPGQELRAQSGGPSYWEGAVDYRGTQTGVGYLEMTGYDQPVTNVGGLSAK